MIREEYLLRATEVNLIALRNLRDITVVTACELRPFDVQRFCTYDRIRIYLELLLRDASTAAIGLVKPHPAVLGDDTDRAETITVEQTGIALATDITTAERTALSRSTPPVGKLPGVYEHTKHAAQKGALLAHELRGCLNELCSMRTGLRRTALPLSCLEALVEMTNDLREALSVTGDDGMAELKQNPGVTDRLTQCLSDAFDPAYESAARSEIANGDLAGAVRRAVEGACCTRPPIFADLIVRYSAI